jgi:serine/threonine protein kinase
MERLRFLQHYRIRIRSDGSPYEVDRNDAATTYEALDERTGEPVSLKLIPAENIDPGTRQQFEDKMSAAQKLRHVNIAKVFDFGREGGDFVYVSEHLPGDTLSAWVHTHGPMRADAALRVAEQIVSVLSSASFHKLPFPPIQPSDVIIVPGQTPEGSWPLVKLTNFGLPAFRSGSEVQSKNSDTQEEALSAEELAGSEQLTTVPSDIRSEIYSLGATLYFLLAGVALSGEASQAAPKLSRFPKPLHTLLARMLHRDPDQRPKDLVVLAEMIRECLAKIERRRALAEKYGIPFGTTIPRPVQPGPGRWIRAALAVGALLLVAAVLAPVLLPGTIGRILHRNRETKTIGVLVGVPENSPPPTGQNGSTTTAPATVASQPANAAAAAATQPPVNVATASNSAQPGSQDRQQAQTANAQPQPAGPSASEASSPEAIAESSSSSASEAQSASKPDGAEQPATAGQSNSQTKKQSVASASRRARGGQTIPGDSTQGRVRSTRGRVVGITSDGRLILRLPSGRTAIVAPDEEGSIPRRHRRAMIDRDDIFAPPPRFEPDYPPYD